MTKLFIYAKTRGMTQRSRKIFFWIAVLIFFVIAPIIVGYAQGYRIDFSRGEIVQVGGIIIESSPKEAMVWLGDKELKNKTPLAIPSLLPYRFYNIKVEKEGFSTWNKNLLVRPEKITPVRNVVLFANEFELEKVLEEENLVDFYISPDTKKVLTLAEDNLLKLTKLGDEKKSFDINLKDGLKTFAIANVRWSNDSDYLVFSRSVWTGLVWYFFDTNSGELINLTRLYEKSLVLNSPTKTPLPRTFSANNLSFLNGDSKILTVISGNLFLIDPLEETLEDLHISNIAQLSNVKKRLLIVKDTDILIEVNEKGENVAVYGTVEFSPSSISVSPDGRKLAFMHDYSVGVVWLEDVDAGETRKKGEQELIYQSPHSIEKFWWHAGSEYIITMLSNGYLVATELDGRAGNRNGANWKLQNTNSFSYSQKEKSLWLLSDESLLKHTEEF